MRQFEFQTTLTAEATLKIPAEIVAQIERNQTVRVVLLLPDRHEEQEWARLTADQFLQGYAESDARYDNLSTG